MTIVNVLNNHVHVYLINYQRLRKLILTCITGGNNYTSSSNNLQFDEHADVATIKTQLKYKTEGT